MGLQETALDGSLADTATAVVVHGLPEVCVCAEELDCGFNGAISGCVSSICYPAAAEAACSSTSCQVDVDFIAAAVRHQQERERRLRPSPHFLAQHSVRQCAAEHITPHMRFIVASWMVEVASEFQLQEETLHLSVALMDRLLSSTQGVPRAVLQTLAVACVLVAAKQLEVVHPSVQELTQLGASSFQACDLLRMERIVLDCLDFHVICPTAHTFLHLLAQPLPGLPRPVAATAAMLSELTFLDYGLLEFDHSVVAVAALQLAMLTAGDCSEWEAVAALASCTPTQLRPCLQQLHRLHRAAMAAPTGGADSVIALYLPVLQRHPQAMPPLAALPGWLQAAWEAA